MGDPISGGGTGVVTVIRVPENGRLTQSGFMTKVIPTATPLSSKLARRRKRACHTTPRHTRRRAQHWNVNRNSVSQESPRVPPVLERGSSRESLSTPRGSLHRACYTTPWKTRGQRMEHFSNLYTSMYSLNLEPPDTPGHRLHHPAPSSISTGRMEVASLPSEEGQASGHVTKRLLQGRPLPAILVDDHPGPRYPTFRPHQRRLSQQKGREGGETTPCDSGVSFSSPEGDPLHHPLQLGPGKTSALSPKTSKPRKKKTTSRRTPVAPAVSVTGTAAGTGASVGPTTGGGTATGTGTTTTGGATLGAPSTGTTGQSGGGGGGQSHVMSSTSSGVSSLGIANDLLQRKAAQKASRMGHHTRGHTTTEGADYFVNPEPVPFMPSNFMSSTMLKKIPIPKRHQDTFGGYEYNFTGQRGVMLHTDRYQVRKQYEALKSLEGLNQRDRLLAEMAYLEDLRSIRRRREVVPHRVQLDLFLGGKKLDCEERFDIKREIQRLKAMAMPARAKDLFHGKGIQLPPTHMSILPRPSRGPAEDSDSEEDFRISAPASLQRTMGQSFNMDLQSPTFERQISLTLGDVPHASSVMRSKRQRLPSISKSQTPRGGVLTLGSSEHPQGWGALPISFSRSSRRDTPLRTRHRPHRAARDDTNLSTSQASGHQTSRSAAWVEEQNQLLSRSHPGTPESTGSVPGGRVGTRLELEIHPPPGSRVHDVDHGLDTEVVAKEGMVKVKDSRQAPSRPGPAASTTATTPAVVEKQKETKQPPSVEQTPSSQSPVPPGSQAPPASAFRSEDPSLAPTPLVQSGSSRGRVQIREDGHRADTAEAPPVSHTPNPLKAGMFMDVSEEQESSLRETFERLDTDMDGHLQYHQLKSQLPKEFSHQQEWFVKQVYEITRSSAAFFGVDEFLMMTQLTNRVAALTGEAQEAFGKIDFDTLAGCIIKYVDLFQRADRSQKGRISADCLRELLGQSQDKAAPEENSRVWNTILDSLSLDYASQVNMTEYLAHIPLFMALAPPTPPPPSSQAYEPSPFPEI